MGIGNKYRYGGVTLPTTRVLLHFSLTQAHQRTCSAHTQTDKYGVMCVCVCVCVWMRPSQKWGGVWIWMDSSLPTGQWLNVSPSPPKKGKNRLSKPFPKSVRTTFPLPFPPLPLLIPFPLHHNSEQGKHSRQAGR